MEREEEQRWIDAMSATLRAERAIAGCNQAELARRTGIARTSLRLYEEGRRQPDVIQLAVIADALHITVGHLVAEAERRARGV